MILDNAFIGAMFNEKYLVIDMMIIFIAINVFLKQNNILRTDQRNNEGFNSALYKKREKKDIAAYL